MSQGTSLEIPPEVIGKARVNGAQQWLADLPDLIAGLERDWSIHGDLHQYNALEAGDGTFKLVDPDGVLAEPEYELSVIMREDPVELMTGDPRGRARWLARRCGLDAVRIWEWGVVERVSTGLVCTQIDLQPVGREMLAAADHIAANHAGS